MSNLKTLLKDTLPELEAHLMSYLGAWPQGLLTQQFDQQKSGCYSLSLSSSSFLDQHCAVTAYLLKDKASSFIFCLVPDVKDQVFSQFFAEMLPFDPWGMTDLNSLPFPNLAATQIDNIKWLYIFCSTATAEQRNDLLDQSKAQIDLKSYPFNDKPANEIFERLRTLSRSERPYVGTDDWQGGLYYFGNAELGNALTAQNHWEIPIKSIPVEGCLYYHEFLPILSLKAPLLELDNPFGDSDDDPVASLSLAANIDTSLWHDVADNLQRIGPPEKHIGLDGAILFRGGNKVELYGQWPVVGDDIILGLSCTLKDIQYWLGPFPVPLPHEIDTEVSFFVSKEQRAVQQIAFQVTLKEWQIVPDFLALSSVDLYVQIYDPRGSKQVVADFSAHANLGKGSGLGLICHGNYPMGDYYLGLDPSTPIHLNGLVKCLLGSSAGLSDGLVISELSGEFNKHTQYLNLTAEVSNEHAWKPSEEHGFKFKGIRLNVHGVDKSYSYSIATSFDASENLHFRAAAIYSGGGWVFSAAYEGSVTLQQVGKAFGFSETPAELNSFKFTGLELSFDTLSGNKFLSGSGEFKFEGKLALLHLEIEIIGSGKDKLTHFKGSFTYTPNVGDHTQELDFKIQFDKNARGYDAVFSLQFALANETVSLQAEKQTQKKKTGKVSNSTFSGHVSGLDIPLSHILEDMLEAVLPSIPTDLLPDFAITEVFVTYKGANKEIILFAKTELEGQEFSFFFHQLGKTTTQKEVYRTFSIHTDLGDLSGLPLVGPQLKDVKVSNVGITYLSHDGEVKSPKITVDEDGVAQLELEQSKAIFLKGINLSGDLSLPTLTAPCTLDLPVSKRKTEENNDNHQNNKATSSKKEPVDIEAEPGNAEKIGTSIGPVNIKKSGLVLKNGRIGIEVTGGLSFAAFEFDLVNLQLTFPPSVLVDSSKLSDFAFGLEGFTADIHKGDLVIAGGFLRKHYKEQGGYDEFSGLVEVRLPPFTLTGMGSYANFQGKPSLFLFAAIGYPIAVHPALLIQGMALGFGIHRDFVTPKLGEIIDYPLIQAATTPPPDMDIVAMVETMHTFFPAMVGEHFVVAGINFKAFGLIDNNAMLAVKFGQHLEIDLLGVSSIALSATFLELEWTVRFLPEEGYLYMGGQITNRSYILMPNVHPTGNFAVAAWTGKQHHGEYVVTIGGYTSNFAAPVHYPQHLERMGMAFNIGMLKIKGATYFAVTPKMIMMGGFLDASIHLGPITGYLKATMDMVIWYQPFHYDIKIGVDAGIKLDIPLLFFTLHINLHLHADMHIWGPDFAGEAFLDISVKTIRIGFGNSKNTVIPSSWNEFQTKFLPQGQVCSLSVTAGVIRKTPYEINGVVKEVYIVNPKQLVVEANSTMPFTEAAGLDSPSDCHHPGIPPMALTAYEAKLTVDISKEEQSDNKNFSTELITSTVPAAIWGNQGLSKATKPDAKDSVMENALTGIRVRPGHDIISRITQPMDKRRLSYNSDDYVVSPETSYAYVKRANKKEEIPGGKVKNTYSHWTGLDFATGSFSSEDMLHTPVTQTLKRAAHV